MHLQMYIASIILLENGSRVTSYMYRKRGYAIERVMHKTLAVFHNKIFLEDKTLQRDMFSKMY